MRGQKGITLVALIITIIVLLILAVVTIAAVSNDGIINYAKNAQQDYNKAQTDENTALANYLQFLKNEEADASLTVGK